MIDLTPLDVRKKKGDFRRGLRGYDALQVDDFLDIVADRLESLVRENIALQERVARFENQATDHREREKALTEALVTAQAMREEVRAQSAREADAARRDAENDALRMRAQAQQVREREEAMLRRLRGRQLEFLQTYRAFLERELAELSSTVRGLEVNGTMSDALMTPPRLPDVAPESGFAAAAATTRDVRRAAAPIDMVTPTPGGASTPRPGEDEGATPVLASPAPSPPEAELILSDEDVLDDDAPTDAIGLAPPAGEDGGGGDLVPELDDLDELADLGPDDAARSLGAKPIEENAEPSAADSERSESRRRNAGDDTDSLLRSLFGDEH